MKAILLSLWLLLTLSLPIHSAGNSESPLETHGDDIINPGDNTMKNNINNNTYYYKFNSNYRNTHTPIWQPKNDAGMGNANPQGYR